MPLTASNAMDRDGFGSRVGYRVLAGMEALIFAGVLYLCASVSNTEKSMIRIQATAEANSLALSTIPALTIRVAEAEKDIKFNSDAITENKERIKDLERRANTPKSKQSGFSL